MPINTLVRVVVSILQGVNGVAQNIFHLKTATSGITNATLTTDIQGWLANMYSGLVTHIPAGATLQYVRVYRWVDGSGFEFQFDTTFAFTAVGGGERIPSVSAPLGSARVLGGGVAKKFFPAVSELSQTDSILTASALAALVTAVGRMVTGPNIIRYQPVTVVPNGETSITSKNIGSTGIATTLLAVQRRRKRGVGV
jgi:hypothetical protein